MRQRHLRREASAALVLLGAAGAQAAGSFTPYLTLDAGFQSLSKDRFDASQTTFQDSPANSNRFGLRGAVDIAPSWQATVQLEGRYFLNGNGPPAQYAANSNVVSRLFDRNANIGLNGPFGDFRFGFINNPVVGAHVAGDIRPAANSGGGIFAWFRNRPIDSSCVDGTCDFTFLQHAVSWKSPTVAGFGGTAHYVLGTGNRDANTTGDQNNGGWGLSANYTTSPFAANLGVQEINDQTGVRIGRVTLANGTWSRGIFSVKLGTTEFRQFKGGVLYTQSSATNTAAPKTIPSVDQTNRLHNVGASVQLTPQWKFSVASYAYRRSSDSTNKIDLSTLAADYAFNHWVAAYAIVSAARNGSAASQSAGYYSLSTVNGASNRAFTVGLRSAFEGTFRF